MHFISASQITPDFIDDFSFFEKVSSSEKKSLDKSVGLVSLFYSPKTRMQLFFASAIKRIGGWSINAPIEDFNLSVPKEDCFEDIATILSATADLAVISSGRSYVPHQISKTTIIPVINAGDGHNENPVQSLIDLYTIWRRFKKIRGLKVMIMGDLSLSPTARSLMISLSNFGNVDLSLVSLIPRQSPESNFLSEIRKTCSVKVFSDPITALYTNPEVVYIDFPPSEFKSHESTKNKFCFDDKCLEKLRTDAIILNPHLKNGISPSVMTDGRCLISEQVHNGVPVIMELLKKIS